MSAWNDPVLEKLFLEQTPLIDVRAPIEFTAGSVPGAVNLPIMNDQERAMVGTCYKERGQAEAIKLGHQLVSGKIKEERVHQWCEAIEKEARTQVFCFRGGLRSQIACQWIREAGFPRRPIEGGYKRLRNFFLSRLEEGPLPELFRLSGFTGSGKTEVLKKMSTAIDLEALAKHRGSAFGDIGPQPSQIDFENSLALRIMQIGSQSVVEDESAVIGGLTIPRRFFLHMRQSPIIVLKVEEDQRIQNIFQDYVLETEGNQLLRSLRKIERALGGVRYKEVLEALTRALNGEKKFENHQRWISLLLYYYYDPLYQKGLSKQKDKIQFEGNTEQVLEFLGNGNFS